ncbi:MAG: excinuclease ABC subunit A [Nitrospirae bacterium]|nr:MAG: excinuclease ABC subunit A [Nitrospirota bacterium]
MDFLKIRKATQNNLKGISLDLPHDSFIAVTGLSGSGKSSLAFDTIFAEGQWRFIESLSTYARLFMEKLDRPEVESISNIRPAIALEQKNPVKGSRSTVGTLTELYDLFRLLFARVGKPYCPKCGEQIRRWSPQSIFSNLLENHNGKRCVIGFKTDRTKAELVKEGFQRCMVGGKIRDIQEVEPETLAEQVEVVADRVVIREEPRVLDSIELAFRQGEGRVEIYIFGGKNGNGRGEEPQRISFSSGSECERCGIKLPDPTPILFSFNHPIGACPECKGFGNILEYDESLIIPDPDLSLLEGAVEPWEKPAARWWKEQLIENAEKSGLDVNKPYRELTEREREILFRGDENIYGIDDFFDDLDSRRYKLHVRVFLSRYRSAVTCGLCNGKRLRVESLSYRVGGYDIAELSAFSIGDLVGVLNGIGFSRAEERLSREIMRQINAKLGFLNRVGLGYLTLDRLGKTLSGGEYQRVNLANQIGARLTGTLYVLDEPTVGLHPRDTARITEIIKEMAEEGNTMIVVEHDRKVIESADWVVELGPGGGSKGGEVVFSGPRGEFISADTPTARYLSGRDIEELNLLRKRKAPVSKRKGLLLKGARGNNLKDIDLYIPLNNFVVVTGVSGSGKSSLVVDTLCRALEREFRLSTAEPLPFKGIEGSENIRGVKLIDQKPIGKSPRSNPATYLKVFDQIRKVFADQPYSRSHGYGPGFFSFNIQGGRCERCRGEGYEKLEMYFFEDLYVPCEECGGKRYGAEALKVTYRGKNIHEVLNMTVDEAVSFFRGETAITSKLQLMQKIALGYLLLGQPATTLSGGEAQRLKICAEIGSTNRKGVLYILDEPTVGLHYRDMLSLLRVLREIVEDGNTVLVIEHNLDLVSVADWVIDLGPEGGPGGGEIVFEGPPERLMLAENSHTGRFLRKEWGL